MIAPEGYANEGNGLKFLQRMGNGGYIFLYLSTLTGLTWIST